MTFLEPIRLWLLVLVAVAGVVYFLLRRHDLSNQAVWFPNQSLYESVINRPRGWVRHMRTALIGLSAVGLILAAANPATLERVPKSESYIELLIDESDSMLNTDIEPTRLAVALEGAQFYVDNVPPNGMMLIGVHAYSGVVRQLVAPTSDYQLVRDTLETLEPSPGTAIGDALKSANDVLAPFVAGTPVDEAVPAAIVLLTDGDNSTGSSIVSALVELSETRIPVYTIGYAVSDQESSVQTLQEIAAATGGAYFEADSGEQLTKVFEHLAQTNAYETIPTSIAYQVALVAGALLLLYALMAAILRPRIPNRKENRELNQRNDKARNRASWSRHRQPSQRRRGRALSRVG